jgi:hypothetical protein
LWAAPAVEEPKKNEKRKEKEARRTQLLGLGELLHDLVHENKHLSCVLVSICPQTKK